MLTMNNTPEQVYITNPLVEKYQPPPTLESVPATTQDMEDFSTVCRLCAKSTECVMPIFQGEGLQVQLAEKIHQHLPIKVTEQDELPVVTCYRCVSSLLAWHDFQQACRDAHHALSARLAATRAPQKSNEEIEAESSAQRLPNISPELGAEPPATRRCPYCPGEPLATDYEPHLVASHPGALFHCEDCNHYINKKVFLAHMSSHAAQYVEADRAARRRQLRDQGGAGDAGDAPPDQQPRGATTAPPQLVIRVAQPQQPMRAPQQQIRVLKQLQVRAPQQEIHAPQQEEIGTPQPREAAPQQRQLRNLQHREIRPQQRQIQTPQQQEVPVPRQQQLRLPQPHELKDPQPPTSPVSQLQELGAPQPQALRRAPQPQELKSPQEQELRTPQSQMLPVPRPQNIQEAGQKVVEIIKIEVIKEPNHKDIQSQEPCATTAKDDNASAHNDEFSDHSDVDDDFGPLPESVFEAIEDSRDSPHPPSADPAPANAANSSNPATAKRVRTCPTCGKSYTASSSFFYHMKVAHGSSKQHECTECGKRFSTRGALRAHGSVHDELRPYECTRCGKSFGARAALYIHEQTHEAVKKHSCDKCGRAFRWRAALARHVARHAAPALRCGRCARAFAVRADLLRHQRTHRPEPQACRLCGRRFAQPRYLQVHLARKHPGAND